MNRLVQKLVDKYGLSDPVELGAGLESRVVRADSARWGPVVVKLPARPIYSNVNDPEGDLGRLFEQEERLLWHIRARGFDRVPEPVAHGIVDGTHYLIQTYVLHDGGSIDATSAGETLGWLHALEAPDGRTEAHEGLAWQAVIAHRLKRRAQVFESLTGGALPLPRAGELEASLRAYEAEERLLHLDVRSANFTAVSGRVTGLLDWSNALVGPPALELARAAEISDIDTHGLLKGYVTRSRVPEVPDHVETIFRLDAAVMLALVFLHEDPDPSQAPRVIERAHSLAAILEGTLQL